MSFLGGGGKQTVGTSQKLILAPEGELEKEAKESQQEQFQRFQDILAQFQEEAPGAGAVGDFARLLQQGPNIRRATEQARLFLQPQFEGLENIFQQQEIQASRQAAALGRTTSDPVLQAKLAQAKAQTLGQLGQQQTQIALGLAENQFSRAQQRAELAQQLQLGGTEGLLGLGSRLLSQERQFRIATAERTGSEIARSRASTLDTIGGLAQIGATVAAACWVARAIFGETNPKWLAARNYICNIGPGWFYNLYIKYGESFSKKVKKSKILKVILRPFFEYFAFRGK